MSTTIRNKDARLIAEAYAKIQEDQHTGEDLRAGALDQQDQEQAQSEVNQTSADPLQQKIDSLVPGNFYMSKFGIGQFQKSQRHGMTGPTDYTVLKSPNGTADELQRDGKFKDPELIMSIREVSPEEKQEATELFHSVGTSKAEYFAKHGTAGE